MASDRDSMTSPFAWSGRQNASGDDLLSWRLPGCTCKLLIHDSVLRHRTLTARRRRRAPEGLTAGRRAGADALGSALMLLFFASIGAGAGGLQTLAGTGTLAAFIGTLLAVHLGVALAGGALLRLDLAAVRVASNAAAGGPGTACAMAAGRGAARPGGLRACRAACMHRAWDMAACGRLSGRAAAPALRSSNACFEEAPYVPQGPTQTATKHEQMHACLLPPASDALVLYP